MENLFFEKLETTKDTVKVSWDGGVHFSEYDKTNAKANGIVFSEEQCPDITKIYVKGQAKTVNDIEVEVHANVAIEGSSKPYPIDLVSCGSGRVTITAGGSRRSFADALKNGQSTGYANDFIPLFGFLPRINYAVGEIEERPYSMPEEWYDATYNSNTFNVCNTYTCHRVLDFISDWALRPMATLIPNFDEIGAYGEDAFIKEKSNYYFDFGIYNYLSPIAEPRTIYVTLRRDYGGCGDYNFQFQSDEENPLYDDLFSHEDGVFPTDSSVAQKTFFAIKCELQGRSNPVFTRLYSSDGHVSSDSLYNLIYETGGGVHEVWVVVCGEWNEYKSASQYIEAGSYVYAYPTSIKLNINVC